MQRSIHIGAIVCVLLLIGCDRSRRQAHDRMTDALNGKRISVTSNHCAVLRLPTRYAALVFSSVGQTSTIRVYVSESGRFNVNHTATSEHSFRQSTISVEGVRVLVAYDGLNASSVNLDWEDTRTGIALSPFTALPDISAASLTFVTNRGFTADDLMQSMQLGN